MAWDPLRDIHQAWQDRLGRLTNPHPEPWAPAIDVYETGDTYVITAEVPGLTREQIAIELKDQRLTISGRRTDRVVSGDAIVHYHQVERGHGAFARTFEFADKIDAERVAADLADGVLAITLRKLPPVPPRRIQVK